MIIDDPSTLKKQYKNYRNYLNIDISNKSVDEIHSKYQISIFYFCKKFY